MKQHVRRATRNDLEAIMAIYNDAILNTSTVFTYEPTPIEELRPCLAAKQSESSTVVVYEY
ncbi:hypothetical protein [Staphylococcus pseudintermedius]|uniref:GNAT family N-acetyltransferase n=1 Tax=Staphylococcus pseudintermedius TaxID=283734 RepID=UPI0015F25394